MKEKTFPKKIPHIVTAFFLLFNLFTGVVLVPRVEAVKIEDVVVAIAQQAMVRKSLQHYEGEGRYALLEEYKKTEGVNNDPTLNAILDRIMTKLTNGIAKSDPSVKDPSYNYFINNDKNFNAFCSLGRNVSVNTGVFAFFDNQEDKIAAVVAHEMAHGQKQHPLRGAKKRLTVDFLQQVIGPDLGTAGELATGIVAVHAKNTGITKSNEKEADNLSFTYMADSGYNVGAPAAVWQRMIDLGGKKSKDFLSDFLNPSTHPGNESRRDNFAKKLHEYSNKKVSVDAKTGEVKVNGKVFMKPTEYANMSGFERSYLIAGNLAAVYHLGKEAGTVYAENGVIKMGTYPIVQPGPSDAKITELITCLEQIK